MKKILLLLATTTALFSCERFAEGVARDIDMPPHNPQIAGSLFIDSRDSMLSATVSETRGLFDTTKTGILKNAELTLLKDGMPLHEWNTLSIYDTYDKDLGDRIGILEGEITFEVSHPDYETVHAVQRFPQKADFTAEVDYGATTWFDETSDALTLDFSDIPGENQHYLISVDLHYRNALSGQDTSEYYPLWLETNNQNAQPINEIGFLLSEEGVDRDLKIRFATGINSIDYLFLVEYRITVKTLSDELYQFYKSYQALENAKGNPFAEPVILYSNMSNDVGCFGLSTTIRKWEG
jgi:hypothetical protein